MWITIIISLATLALGAVGSYFILKPKLDNVQKLNMQVIEQNNCLKTENEELIQNKNQLSSEVKQLQEQKIELDATVHQIENGIMNSKAIADKAADTFYEQSMELAKANLERSLEEEALKHQEAIANFEKELAAIMQEGSDNFIAQTGLQKDEIEKLSIMIAELRAKAAAAVEAAKREEEKKNSLNFYRIQLTDIDLEEIEILRSISYRLRDKEILNKIIWKCYYEKPTNDLIGRVIGGGIHSGIYKITHIESQKCYVGQAVNLADRWKQHIKRGVGADPPTRNKLYPAMIEFGPENFTFEVVEECSRNLLDEREDYWQDYFKAKEFGYSIK